MVTWTTAFRKGRRPDPTRTAEKFHSIDTNTGQKTLHLFKQPPIIHSVDTNSRQNTLHLRKQQPKSISVILKAAKNTLIQTADKIHSIDTNSRQNPFHLHQNGFQYPKFNTTDLTQIYPNKQIKRLFLGWHYR